MPTPKPIRWILYILGGLIAGLLLIILLLAVIRIPIDLTNQKGLVESAASLALGRSVTVDNKIVITTSLQPIFSLEGLRISNPKGFEKGDFLRMKTAEFQVHVLPLLQGKIKIALKYHPITKIPAITKLERVSTPGLRKYVGAHELPRVMNGLGIAIMSTSTGVITDKEARNLHVGGEVICYVS